MFELTQPKLERQPKKRKEPTADKLVNWRQDLHCNWPFYVMLRPAVISVARGYWDSEWVGLKGFIAPFESPFFIKVIRNTAIIKALQTLVGIPSALLVAGPRGRPDAHSKKV